MADVGYCQIIDRPPQHMVRMAQGGAELRFKQAELERLRRGSTGWMYGAAGVILWDLLVEEDEQLTRAFRRGARTRPILLIAGWGYLTGHLFGVIPDQFDIIHLAGVAYRRQRHGNQSASPGSGAGSST